VSVPIAITSLDDSRVDLFRNVRDADLRGRDDLFMAESEMVVRRLLAQPDRIHSVLVSPAKMETLADGLTQLPPSIPIYVASLELLSAIAGFHVHRGVLATGFRPDPATLTVDAALGHLKARKSLQFLLAEGLTNVDNMGMLFRNAAAFGIDGVILDRSSCDPLYRKAIRVSVGHVLATPWAVVDDLAKTVAELRTQWGMTILAAETGRDAVPIWDAAVTDRIGIVVGAEATGLRDATAAACTAICEIPMAHGVPSLNVGTATAVMLYEILRRTHQE
jgi:tRNA G18 (ribose-2'-O)-methylase SpoU